MFVWPLQTKNSAFHSFRKVNQEITIIKPLSNIICRYHYQPHSGPPHTHLLLLLHPLCWINKFKNYCLLTTIFLFTLFSSLTVEMALYFLFLYNFFLFCKTTKDRGFIIRAPLIKKTARAKWNLNEFKEVYIFIFYIFYFLPLSFPFGQQIPTLSKLSIFEISNFSLF